MPSPLLTAGALLGAFFAFVAPAADRVCGTSDGGKFRWCMVIVPPDQCGTDAEWHCDIDGSCWCGPAEALENPRADASGLPLIGREAEGSGHRCSINAHDGAIIGDCGIAGWICNPNGWCQDSANRQWWATRGPRS